MEILKGWEHVNTGQVYAIVKYSEEEQKHKPFAVRGEDGYTLENFDTLEKAEGFLLWYLEEDEKAEEETRKIIGALGSSETR